MPHHHKPKKHAHHLAAKGHAHLAAKHARAHAAAPPGSAKRAAHRVMHQAHKKLAQKHAEQARDDVMAVAYPNEPEPVDPGGQSSDAQGGFASGTDEGAQENWDGAEDTTFDTGTDPRHEPAEGEDTAIPIDNGGDEDGTVGSTLADETEAEFNPIGNDALRDSAEYWNAQIGEWHGEDLSDTQIAGFFGDMFKSIGHAFKSIGKAIGKVGKAIIHSPITKIIGAGLSLVIPPAGVAVLAGVATAEKLLDAAKGVHDVVRDASGKLRKLTLADVKKRQLAAVHVLANTVKAAKQGHPDAKNALKVLQLVKKQHANLRTPHASGEHGYEGVLVQFTKDRRTNGRALRGHWARAVGPGTGIVLGTVVVGRGRDSHLLQGWWRHVAN